MDPRSQMLSFSLSQNVLQEKTRLASFISDCKCCKGLQFQTYGVDRVGAMRRTLLRRHDQQEKIITLINRSTGRKQLHSRKNQKEACPATSRRFRRLFKIRIDQITLSIFLLVNILLNISCRQYTHRKPNRYPLKQKIYRFRSCYQSCGCYLQISCQQLYIFVPLFRPWAA